MGAGALLDPGPLDIITTQPKTVDVTVTNRSSPPIMVHVGVPYRKRKKGVLPSNIVLALAGNGMNGQ